MSDTTVQALHRLTVPVTHNGEVSSPVTVPPIPPGTSVLLELGEGRYMYRFEARKLAALLSQCSHIFVTGTLVEEFGGDWPEHIFVGPEQIAAGIRAYVNDGWPDLPSPTNPPPVGLGGVEQHNVPE